MSKCEWYVVCVLKTMCGAVKIRKRKVDRRPCCMCYCIGDWLIKALPILRLWSLAVCLGVNSLIRLTQRTPSLS